MNTIIGIRPENTRQIKSAPVFQKAERIFDRSLQEFNDGHIYQSLQTAKYALNIARRYNKYCKVNICLFIAQIKKDFGQVKLAEYYSIQALKYLKKDHPDYSSDKKFIDELLNSLLLTV